MNSWRAFSHRIAGSHVSNAQQLFFSPLPPDRPGSYPIPLSHTPFANEKHVLQINMCRTGIKQSANQP